MVDFSSLLSVLMGKLILEAESQTDYAEEVNGAMNATLRSCRPLAFVKVRSKEDVINTIRFCTESKLELCVTSGGKNTNFAIADGAVVLDLSDINHVIVDKTHKTAVVGGGAKHRDVDDETVRHGLVTSLGVYPELGVAGVTLLGGNGLLSREHGLSCDNVLEYELVTADGEVVKASERENPDLFWGMKGYGFNYGVVTSITFQLHDIPPLVVGVWLTFPVSQAKVAMKTVRDFLREKADRKLACELLPHVSSHGPILICRMLYSGLRERGESLINELCERTKPEKKEVKIVGYDQFQTQMYTIYRRGLHVCKTGGQWLQELTDDVIDILIDEMAGAPSPELMTHTTIYMISFGGRIQEIPEDSSAYPYRQAEYFVGITAFTKDVNFLNTLKKWVETTEKRISGYQLQIDPAIDGRVRQKLRQLKRKYDPSNTFHHNINIDPGD